MKKKETPYLKKKEPIYKPEIVNAMRGYKKRFLLNDLFAGFMIALVALPLNIAMGQRQADVAGFYAVIQIGLWAAIIGGVLLSIFGGTRFSVGGPTAPFITIIVILFTFPNFGITELFFTVALAGVILIVVGLLKGGKLLKFISYPALIGICLGIGVTLLFNLISDLGFSLADPTATTNAIASISPFLSRLILTFMGFRYFATTGNLIALVVGGVAIFLTYLIPKIHKKLPSFLIAIVISTALYWLFYLGSGGALHSATINNRFGNVEPAWNAHFLNFATLNWGAWQMYLFAFAIAIIAALEGMTSATAVSNMSGVKYNANAELVGLGAANLGSGLLGGLPITGAMARTNLNYEVGAKSNLSGIFQSVFLLIFYVALMRFIGIVPMASLTAPLVKVAIATSFFPLVLRLLRFTKRDCSILVITGLVTIFLGVHFGVIAGVLISFLVNARSYKDKMVITKGEATVQAETALQKEAEAENAKAAQELTQQNEAASLNEEEAKETVEEVKGIKRLVLSVKGTIFFANVHKLLNKVKEELPNADKIVLDMSGVNSLDATAVEKLSKLTKNISKTGKRLRVINLSEKLRQLYIKAFQFVIKVW